MPYCFGIDLTIMNMALKICKEWKMIHQIDQNNAKEIICLSLEMKMYSTKNKASKTHQSQ